MIQTRFAIRNSNGSAEKGAKPSGGLREACHTGKRFTAVLPNRRKDDSAFNNLLDLRTLEVREAGRFHVLSLPCRTTASFQGQSLSVRTGCQNTWYLQY